MDDNPYKSPEDQTYQKRWRIPTALGFGNVTLTRAIVIALLWQLIPSALLLLFVWNNPTIAFYLLAILVLIVIPISSGFVHKSLTIAITALVLPFLAFALMMCMFICILLFG